MYDYEWDYLDSSLSVVAIIIIVVIWIGASVGLSFIPANMAKKKGYSFAGFYCLSFFVSFVIAIIIAAVIQDKNPPPQYGQYYGPPYGQPYPPYGQPYPPPYGQPYAPPSQPVVNCPSCGAAIPASDPFCSKCGVRVK